MYKCSECGSSNVKIHFTRKRGTLVLAATVLSFIATLYFDLTGLLWFGIVLMFYYSIKAIYLNKILISCKDCWCSKSERL